MARLSISCVAVRALAARGQSCGLRPSPAHRPSRHSRQSQRFQSWARRRAPGPCGWGRCWHWRLESASQAGSCSGGPSFLDRPRDLLFHRRQPRVPNPNPRPSRNPRANPSCCCRHNNPAGSRFVARRMGLFCSAAPSVVSDALPWIRTCAFWRGVPICCWSAGTAGQLSFLDRSRRFVGSALPLPRCRHAEL